MLAALLASDPATRPQLAGIAVGNPVMLCYQGNNPVDQKVVSLQYSFHVCHVFTHTQVGDVFTNFNQLYWNGFVSQSTYEQWWEEGCESQASRDGNAPAACFALLEQVMNTTNEGVDFNPDDAFADPCTGKIALHAPSLRLRVASFSCC
jgi:hypothetical protein